MKKAAVNSIILIMMQSLLFCGTKEGCEYFDSMNLYFANTFNVDLAKFDKTKALYFIPLESCENCIYSNLLMLQSVQTNNLIIVFVGNNYHQEWDILIEELRGKYNCFDDYNKEIYKYESGLGKPLLLKIKNGECLGSKSIYENDLKEIKNELNQL